MKKDGLSWANIATDYIFCSVLFGSAFPSDASVHSLRDWSYCPAVNDACGITPAITYQGKIVETLARTVTVEAASAEDAERCVWD